MKRNEEVRHTSTSDQPAHKRLHHHCDMLQAWPTDTPPHTCGSISSSVQASSTTLGAAKQAKLSMWPLVSSSPTSPLGSQMTFCFVQ